jgi:hypothetical protein
MALKRVEPMPARRAAGSLAANIGYASDTAAAKSLFVPHPFFQKRPIRFCGDYVKMAIVRRPEIAWS